jgi:hypothetical protein
MPMRFRPAIRNVCSQVKLRRRHTTGMLLAIVCVIALWPLDLWANTCVARKPTPVFGTLCGVGFDPSGARLVNAILRSHNETGPDETEIHAASEGEFQFRFSAWPQGIYRVTTPSTGMAKRCRRSRSHGIETDSLQAASFGGLRASGVRRWD